MNNGRGFFSFLVPVSPTFSFSSLISSMTCQNNNVTSGTNFRPENTKCASSHDMMKNYLLHLDSCFGCVVRSLVEIFSPLFCDILFFVIIRTIDIVLITRLTHIIPRLSPLRFPCCAVLVFLLQNWFLYLCKSLFRKNSLRNLNLCAVQYFQLRKNGYDKIPIISKSGARVSL